MQNICTLLLCLLCSTFSLAQNCNYTLTGKVSDLHDNKGLAYAYVHINETNDTIKSDKEGNYTATNLCAGKYTLVIFHEECNVVNQTITLTENTKLDIKLEHHLEELNEVLIKGKSKFDKLKSVNESKISALDLIANQGNSLGQILNTVSGVSSLNTGSTVLKPIINGLHSSRITTITSGTRLEDQEWGTEHAPNINLNGANGITVVKNAAALQYSGDAIGGAIIIEPKNVPVKDTLYGFTNTNLSTNGRGGSLNTNLTKSYNNGWFAEVNAGVKRFGDFETPDYVLSNTGINNKTFSGRIGFNRFRYKLEADYSYSKKEIGILSASHIGGAQDQVRALKSSMPLIINDFTYTIKAPRQEVTHQIFRLKSFAQVSDKFEVNLNYSFQKNNRLEFDVRRRKFADIAAVDLELKTHSLNLDTKFEINDKTLIKSGLFSSLQNNFADPSTGVRRLIPDFDRFQASAYGILDYEWSKQLSLETGARIDYINIDSFKFYRTSFWNERGYNTTQSDIIVKEYGNQILTNPKLSFTNFAATAGLKYKFSAPYILFFNYAFASRAPNPSELFSEGLHHSAARIELGDLTFKQETSQKVSLSLQKKGTLFSGNISTYINRINNFITIVPVGIRQTIRGNFQVWEYQQVNTLLYGFDLDTNLAITKTVTLNNQLSFIKGYDTENKIALNAMPATQFSSKLHFKPKALKGFNATLEHAYTFRQNEFPDQKFDVFLAETNSNETVDLSTPPAAYQLINMSASYPLKITKNNELLVQLSANNLLNETYRNYLNRQRFYADETGRNITLRLTYNY